MAAPEDGQVTYAVDIDGAVAVWLRVNADNGSNSFWIRSNDDSFVKFDDFNPLEGWYWLKWTSLLYLMNTFWFMKEIETLLFAQAYIERLETEDVNLSNVAFKPDSSIPRPSILSVLSAFMYSSSDNFRIALNLLFDYLEKQPENLPKVPHILVEDFGFKPTSFSSKFLMQRVVTDELQQRIRDDDDFFARLFIALAEKYLHISLEVTKLKGNILNMIHFELHATPKLFELRRQLWEQVFRLYDDPKSRDDILSAVYTYSIDGYRINTKEISEVDAASVLPFLSKNLESKHYIHCVIAHKFLDLLERHQIPFDPNLREYFLGETYSVSMFRCYSDETCERMREEIDAITWCSEKWKCYYKLSKLFLHGTFSRRELELDFHEFEAYKRERIRAHFEPFNSDDFKRFFEQALAIQGNLAGINPHQLMTGVENIFEGLAERDSELFAVVLGHYLQLGDPLRLSWIPRVVLRLIQSLGAEDTLALLKNSIIRRSAGGCLVFT